MKRDREEGECVKDAGRQGGSEGKNMQGDREARKTKREVGEDAGDREDDEGSHEKGRRVQEDKRTGSRRENYKIGGRGTRNTKKGRKI